MIRNFFEFTNELFNTTMGINWIISNDTHLEGFFKQGSNKYEINSVKFDLSSFWRKKNVWSYEFRLTSVDNGYKTTNIQKKQYLILSTVIKGFNFLIKEKEPDIIYFITDKNEVSKSKVYDSIITKYNDWKINKYYTENNCVYILSKNNDVSWANLLFERLKKAYDI